jgi:hypothetical protein
MLMIYGTDSKRDLRSPVISLCPFSLLSSS